jgi:hypothetical protein
MSISRWFYELLEMLNWMDGGEEEWSEFLFNPTITTVSSEDAQIDVEEEGKKEPPKIPEIPDHLPILL